MRRAVIDGYPHRSGGHCGSASLRDLLEWAGLGWDGPPDEGLVFGLAAGLDFQYFVTPWLSPPFYLQGRHLSLERDLCARLGIGFDAVQTDDPEEGWAQLAAQLDAGRPVLAWADISELPYLRVTMSNTFHDVVITGYDLDAGIAFIADNDRADIQSVPLQTLARARDSMGFPAPNRHATFPLNFPTELPALLPAARDAAGTAVTALRTGDRPADPIIPEDVDIYYGLDGVRRFAADVTAWPDRLEPEELSTTLRALWIFIEKAGTGGGLFRRLQAAFCHRVAALSGDTAFAAAGDAYDACARAWTRLATVSDPSDLPDAAEPLPSLEELAAQALAEAAVKL
ncbi:BtrH N-terminal domain-containing protein [Actinomadura sp. 7K507]|uniref:BtrH N-terminal domain-containing protein n=1 Tax=Actinomadura sp. 7K507 TaxID=2530365 RepID=UPI001A9F913D|nr:BtrH N-terminal domain-containing protein [Actinomadura sp. 7K507]